MNNAVEAGAGRHGQNSAFSRRETPELCEDDVPPINRGRGEDRVLSAHPRSACIKGSTRQNHRWCRIIRPSLRNGFTAYIALSPGTGLFCPRHFRGKLLPCENLAPASGRQDHTTSPSASAPLVLRRQGVHRIPLRVRDVAQRPSVGRDQIAIVLIWPSSQE